MRAIILTFRSTILLSFILFFQHNIAVASGGKEYIDSAIKYNELNEIIMKDTSKEPFAELYNRREKQKDRLLTSHPPTKETLIELSLSTNRENKIAAILNILLRQLVGEDYLQQVLNLIEKNQDDYMIKFYSYSYLDDNSIKLLSNHKKQILYLLSLEKDENLFIVNLPLLVRFNSKQTDKIIEKFLLKSSLKIKKVMCGYIEVNNKLLAKKFCSN